MVKKKRFILTKHAKQRMRQRGVSLDNIRDTLDRPTKKSPIEKDNTQEFSKKIGSKRCYVVVEHKDSRNVVIITVGW